MAKLYYDLICKQLKRIGDVPPRWRAETQALLDAEEVANDG